MLMHGTAVHCHFFVRSTGEIGLLLRLGFSSMGLLQKSSCEHSCTCLLGNMCPHFCWVCTYLGEELLSPGVGVCLSLVDIAKVFRTGCSTWLHSPRHV